MYVRGACGSSVIYEKSVSRLTLPRKMCSIPPRGNLIYLRRADVPLDRVWFSEGFILNGVLISSPRVYVIIANSSVTL